MLVPQKIADIIDLIPPGKVGRPRKSQVVAPRAKKRFWGPIFERDIEYGFIEPLLEKLGYSAENCTRRPCIDLVIDGKNVTIKPDYSFGNMNKPSMVVESKLEIHSRHQFSRAYHQVTRYGLMLDCKVVATAAFEGLWIFPQVNGEFSDVVHVDWVQLDNSEVFNDVAAIIGPAAVLL